MAAKKANPGFKFIIASLKKNKKATYKDISAAAAKKKLKLFPVMFGRAQAMLGIVKQSKRGAGKVARRKAQKAKAARIGRRGPGRPRKASGPSIHGRFDELGHLVRVVGEAVHAQLNDVRTGFRGTRGGGDRLLGGVNHDGDAEECHRPERVAGGAARV